MRILLATPIIFALLLQAALADDTNTQLEISALLEAVAASGCAFTRNGSEHDSEEAADHLRLKARRGKSYYDSPDQFIDRLATKSSWSGKPYSVQCPGEPSQDSRDWLHGLLDNSRAQEPSQP